MNEWLKRVTFNPYSIIGGAKFYSAKVISYSGDSNSSAFLIDAMKLADSVELTLTLRDAKELWPTYVTLVLRVSEKEQTSKLTTLLRQHLPRKPLLSKKDRNLAKNLHDVQFYCKQENRMFNVEFNNVQAQFTALNYGMICVNCYFDTFEASYMGEV